MGETYTSSGICQDGKSPAFCAMHDCKSAESFCPASRGVTHAFRGLPRVATQGLGGAWTTTQSVEERPKGGPERARGEARSAEYCAAKWINGVPEKK
jgi:hypothetical protein